MTDALFSYRISYKSGRWPMFFKKDTGSNPKKKYIIALVSIVAVTVLLEVFAFNFSSWRSAGKESIVLAKNATTDESGEFISEVVTVDGPVYNVDADIYTENYDIAYVSVILTDEGDKYEYALPEYVVCNDVPSTGFSNIYPFDDVHTICVRVRAPEGCRVLVNSVVANAKRPIDIKPVRMLAVFVIIFFGYLVWTPSKLHELYYDEKKMWQKVATILCMAVLILVGKKVTTADPLLMDSPWPHHKQYQELAHSLAQGTVELTEHVADPALVSAENPYDTIALWVEQIPYSMDYAYYEGKYYEYFGIAPELLFYYPYYCLKGSDLPNYKAVYGFYILFVIGVFLTTSGIVKRYVKSIPYFYFLLINAATVFLANFLYLTFRSDIYNIPIIGAVSCTFMGIGLWLHGLSVSNRTARITLVAGGSLFMAFVAGCRPQLLLLSGVAIIWFLFEKGWKERKILSGKTIPETIAFFAPYILAAALVCWYNFARFGNIFDFGATYSLTTNDMNHRGFNMNRLLRSLYCFLFQPATVNTDFPFLMPSQVEGNYMGRFLSEYTYGGILIANTFFICIWLWFIRGIKKTDRAIKATVLFFVLGGVVIAAFDANAAGVLYRYTCDFAPAFALAAILLWFIFLDRGRVLADYTLVSRLAYIAVTVSIFYSLMTFMTSGDSVGLIYDNRKLYYTLASYFRW